VLTTAELRVVDSVMNGDITLGKTTVPPHPNLGDSSSNREENEPDVADILRQYLLQAKDVHLDKKIGAGAFGEPPDKQLRCYASHDIAPLRGTVGHHRAYRIGRVRYTLYIVNLNSTYMVYHMI